jgi:hypothetical protein
MQGFDPLHSPQPNLPTATARCLTLNPDGSCSGAVTVQAVTIPGYEDRAGVPLTDGQVDGASGARRKRDGDGLAALTVARREHGTTLR